MNNEKEIERMAKITGLCDYPDMSCEQCRLKHNMHLCMHKEAMRKLANAGKGDKKQAVKEAFEKLKDKILLLRFCDVPTTEHEWDMGALADVTYDIDELFTELYGADE